MSKAFELLHPTVQRKLWDMKWTELRPIQIDAIQHLLGGVGTDCIICSPTASGKTEAAFLPILSSIADEPMGSVRAMYIGPLKALINDQFGRIEQLCERMEMPVHRWHGDVDDSGRKALLAAPSGVLLITPESLEAMFVLRATQLRSLFGKLAYVVIDETHAFLSSPRGAQLISQLHRLRVRTATDPVRVGLSATLGDPLSACRWLRRDGRPVRVIESSSGSSEIRLKLRGIWRHASEESDSDSDDPALVEVARGILTACHGKTNLVFANAKSMIEALADELLTQARAINVGDDIVVHHGSLSKDEREHAEERLRSGRPCTAVCSNTLELGIDIGSIDEVVQVSPPWSVASLVQRLGRSGRRPGSPRILRGFFVEDFPSSDASIWNRLHLDFIRGLASIELMLEGWMEAPDVDRTNFSTLIQQVLSSLAETGGIRAQDLYTRLAESGAFVGLRRGDFVSLLRELGARDLIEQLPDATLVLGLKGQRIVEHYSFYAAFKAPTEFQVIFRDRTIGALPESILPGPGEHLILAGRRWLVEEIDVDRRQVHVSPSKGRRPPRFAAGPADLSPTLHARMRSILLGEKTPKYLDATAADILVHARRSARDACVDVTIRMLPDRAVLSLWAGTRIHRTLWLALLSAGVRVESASDVALEIIALPAAWLPVLKRFVDAPDGRPLAQFAEEKLFARIRDGEKFDMFLPAELWRASYVRERLDIDGAVRVAARVVMEASNLIAPDKATSFTPRVVAIPDLRHCVDEIAALEVRGPFPGRVVLVHSEAHAHALRVELATRAPHLLAGTRFLTAAAAARSVLDHAGIPYRAGEEELRPLRVRRLLGSAPALSTYRAEDLGSAGWEQAFASTIEELESAALRPEDLEALEDPRVADLVTVWRALDQDAAASWTLARILAEARALMLRQPDAWPFNAPVLAIVSAGVDTAHARLLQRVPSLTVGIIPGRPARSRALERARGLFGDDAARLLGTFAPAASTATELEVMATFLFEAPDRLVASDRLRSQGPDGTVALELHAGVDEELAAAARWVADEVFEHRTPLQEIAVLVPNPDPLASLIADRIRALPWPAHQDPVYLSCGRPASATAAGARLLAVVGALAELLPAHAMVEILPRLRLADSNDHLSPGLARDLVHELGTASGSVRQPRDLVQWRERVSKPEVAATLRGVGPAIDAMVSVAERIVDGASLAQLWSSIRAFASLHLIAPRDMSEILDLLDKEISWLANDSVTSRIVGLEAVELIQARLISLRLHAGRFGYPAIFVGTIASAAGLRFSAVRILGLSEGSFPGTQREDPILPTDLRRKLPAHTMLSGDDYATGRLHAFDQVIRGTTKRLVLSAPRTDFDGSEREPASLFVEAAAALGRPNSITGAIAHGIPTGPELERDAFRVARADAAARRTAAPLSAACWLHHVAEARTELPSGWGASLVVNPLEVIARSSTMDGLLGPLPLTSSDLGSAELPLSASALRVLLTCPQRFLMERVLGFWPRGELRPTHVIGFLEYGALFHRIAEAFSRQHGDRFGAREQDLASWLAVADRIAVEELDSFVSTYPLATDAVIELERRRLRRDVRTLIEDDWCDGKPRRFVVAEVEFGKKEHVSISTSIGPLFVTGRIDRIDVEDGVTIVRDLKTGRSHPRERDHADPEVALDLQLAVYVEVTKQLAAQWSVPAEVSAGYSYVDPFSTNRERAFRADRHLLQAKGREWFDLSMSLIRDHAFVRTPDPQDCSRCPFSSVCGDATDAVAEMLRDATGPLVAFRDLKT